MIDSLAGLGARTASVAAIDFLLVEFPKTEIEDGLATLQDLLRVEVKAAIGPALADSRDALEANMSAAAEVTFVASMALAGIRAAKAWGSA